MKNKLLGTVLIFLVVANMVTLGVFWYYKIHNMPPAPPTNGPGGGDASAFIIKQVGFTPSQQTAYHNLVKEHQQKVRPIREELHVAKDGFFDMLSDTTVSAAKIDEASSNIGKLEKALDVQTFDHFKEVRAMCTPDQKIKLDNCIKQVMRMMGPPPPGGRPPGPPPGMGHGRPSELPPPGEGPPPPQGERPPQQ